MHNMRTAIIVWAALVFFGSPCKAQEQSAGATRIPACGNLPNDQKWIGDGDYGLKFKVPKRGVKILGGADVDYVKFIIKPANRHAALLLWFGPYALNPKPRQELLENSARSTQTEIMNSDGNVIGYDTKGQNHDSTTWRQFSVLLEGAVYENASASDTALFDRIIESACIVPYPSSR
jgi:hypothetical protein